MVLLSLIFVFISAPQLHAGEKVSCILTGRDDDFCNDGVILRVLSDTKGSWDGKSLLPCVSTSFLLMVSVCVESC